MSAFYTYFMSSKFRQVVDKSLSDYLVNIGATFYTSKSITPLTFSHYKIINDYVKTDKKHNGVWSEHEKILNIKYNIHNFTRCLKASNNFPKIFHKTVVPPSPSISAQHNSNILSIDSQKLGISAITSHLPRESLKKNQHPEHPTSLKRPDIAFLNCGACHKQQRQRIEIIKKIPDKYGLYTF